MALIKRHKHEAPFVNSIFNELWDMNDFFGGKKLGSRLPSVNVSETHDSYLVELAAPGLSKKDFNISLENGCLSISTQKEESKEEKKKDYTRREYSFNEFERSFTLPDSVDKDAVQAKYKDGVLSIALEKTAKAKKEEPKTIAIN